MFKTQNNKANESSRDIEDAILGIKIISDRSQVSSIIKKEKKGKMSTVNANILCNAYKEKDYRRLLQNNTINICDGSLIAIFFNLILGKNIVPYPGPDFFIDHVKDEKYTHVFVGSTPQILEGLRQNLNTHNKRIDEYLFLPLPFKSAEEFDYLEISRKINNTNPDFIWVSLGAPKQEIFSSKLFDYIKSGFVVPVGAAFEFYSGNGETRRCPFFLRKCKLEWFHRLIRQPKKTWARLKRELIYVPLILVKEFFNLNEDINY